MKSVTFILGCCLMLAIPIDPVVAQSDRENKCKDGVDNDGDTLTDCDDDDCASKSFCAGGDPGSGDGFSALGAVGHPLSCLPLPCGGGCAPVGDFHDLGTVDNGCELLTCGSGNGQNLVCGRQSDPTPILDINGLDYLWFDADTSQGDFGACFGSGTVAAKVHTENSGSGDQIHVWLFFASGVDGDLSDRCEGSEIVRYSVEIDGCTLADATSNYPPAVGEETIVACPGGIAEIAVKTEGGGFAAKKCGCEATGVLITDTDLNFRGQ